MAHAQKLYAARIRLVAGRDPILPACLRAKSPSGLRESRPATEIRAVLPLLVFCRVRKFKIVIATLQRLSVSTCLDWKGRPMPLLKPPEGQITTRRFFVRIEDPLALTMERYAEFLGTDNLDHVVGQALQFVFKRDTQFKSWLEQNPEGTPKPVQSKASSKRTTTCGGAQ